MIKSISCFIILLLLFACNNPSEMKSTHVNIEFFYPLDTIPKIYLYRDVAKGLEEEFHRVYHVKDSEGHHIIVERYASDGRILEALNYNVDSLDIQDHMVVNIKQEKTKAILYKNKIFPTGPKDQTWFASKFQGLNDSTLFLREIKRQLVTKHQIRAIMEEDVECIVFDDFLRQTLINPFTQKENTIQGHQNVYFGKGIGLVEWQSSNKKMHFRLEQILSQEEWLKIISR